MLTNMKPLTETPAMQESYRRAAEPPRNFSVRWDSFRDFLKREAKKGVKWLANSDSLARPRRLLKPVVLYALRTKRDFALLFYDTPERRPILDLIYRIRDETEMVLSNNEAFQIYAVVKAVQKIQGDMAEVGVYQGGSAKLICEAGGGRPLFLFDSFEGIPSTERIDENRFSRGQFAASLEGVREYLGRYPDVRIYKGTFPASSAPIVDKKFSFVHIDVDTYESTRECLNFFYPRMSPGGAIISHDYMSAAGVRLAVDEFFRDKREAPIEMSGSEQCLVVKM